MAPGGRQEPRTSRKENQAGNRRFSSTPSEDLPVSGSNVPFEELLARELRKSQDKEENVAMKTNGAKKKTFLKRGARGWWMRQPGAKQKVTKHILTSKDEDKEATLPVMGKTEQPEANQQQKPSSPSSSGTLSPVTSPPDRVRNTAARSQTLSPPVSPIRRLRYSSDGGSDDEKFQQQQQRQQIEEFAAWKEASLRSNASTDLMGMNRVRQSYEAKQQREANEMAEFEAIERDLAAEKEAYLLEREKPPQDLFHDNQAEESHWGLPYSSFVSDLHQQEHLRRHSTRVALMFDNSLDGGANSAPLFDDRSSIAQGEWKGNHDEFSTDPLGNGRVQPVHHLSYPPSELSAISFDDSEPWDDGLSFQPPESTAPAQSIKFSAETGMMGRQNKHYGSYDGVRSTSDTPGYDTFISNQEVSKGDAPVSSLVQHIFGEDKSASEDRLSFENESAPSCTGESREQDGMASGSVPSQQPTPDNSLSTLKQKLRGKQKFSATRVPVPQRKSSVGQAGGKRTGSTKLKATAPLKSVSNQKSGANAKPARGRGVHLTESNTILPAVIEEKLYELEEEVKFYKSETLQLQKRKDYYDQEMKKLARERDEFVHYQQEQRELIEKEWEKERAKMKKEQKLQERQWKLRMNATISHQDRKDRGEVEALKAQIVKMQLDEKARVAKWKSGSDNLRQRVLELEEKNRELSDEIKFLEKDRLEQWEKYERLLKGKHEMSTVTSKDIVTSAVAPAAPSELRTVDDIFAIKGTAEALLKDWSFPLEEEVPANGSKNQERVSIADSRLQQSVHLNIVDGYNPKRYSLGRSSDGSWTFTGGGCSEAKSDSPGVTSNGDGFRDGKNVNDNSATTGFKWAFPSADDEQALHNTAYSGSTSEDGDHNNDGIVLTSVTLHSEPKVVSQEIEHSGGKKELMYSDGSKKIVFPDGNVKDVDANGHIIIKFTNGDHKEIFPDTGISVYYYFEAKTKLTTYPDNRKVYEFPNQQIETSLPDGSTEIQFADGIKKTIRANGDEFSVFPDGTTMLEQPDGLREVTLLNQKKIRYFPDGEMACVSSSGQETRVQSDSELRKLMESS